MLTTTTTTSSSNNTTTTTNTNTCTSIPSSNATTMQQEHEGGIVHMIQDSCSPADRSQDDARVGADARTCFQQQQQQQQQPSYYPVVDADPEGQCRHQHRQQASSTVTPITTITTSSSGSPRNRSNLQDQPLEDEQRQQQEQQGNEVNNMTVTTTASTSMSYQQHDQHLSFSTRPVHEQQFPFYVGTNTIPSTTTTSSSSGSKNRSHKNSADWTLKKGQDSTTLTTPDLCENANQQGSSKYSSHKQPPLPPPHQQQQELPYAAQATPSSSAVLGRPSLSSQSHVTSEMHSLHASNTSYCNRAVADRNYAACLPPLSVSGKASIDSYPQQPPLHPSFSVPMYPYSSYPYASQSVGYDHYYMQPLTTHNAPQKHPYPHITHTAGQWSEYFPRGTNPATDNGRFHATYHHSGHPPYDRGARITTTNDYVVTNGTYPLSSQPAQTQQPSKNPSTPKLSGTVITFNSTRSVASLSDGPDSPMNRDDRSNKSGSVDSPPEQGTDVANNKKKRKKKPKDCPRRPLSAYNFFFKDERRVILEAIPSTKNNAKTEDEKLRESITWPGKKRPPHGKIGFESLAKVIGERWKHVDSTRMKYYKDLAVKDLQRYAEEMKEYEAKQMAKRIQAAASANGTNMNNNSSDHHDDDVPAEGNENRKKKKKSNRKEEEESISYEINAIKRSESPVVYTGPQLASARTHNSKNENLPGADDLEPMEDPFANFDASALVNSFSFDNEDLTSCLSTSNKVHRQARGSADVVGMKDLSFNESWIADFEQSDCT